MIFDNKQKYKILMKKRNAKKMLLDICKNVDFKEHSLENFTKFPRRNFLIEVWTWDNFDSDGKMFSLKK